MMGTRIRYNAFTLLEITVAMLIAAICMGIAFYVLSTFTQIGETQQREKQREFLLQRFQHRMQRETVEAARIGFIDQTLLLEQAERQTAYIFLDSALVRTQNGLPTDTLAGVIDGLVIDYLPNLPQEVVRTCRFELHTDNGRYPFVLQKEYSAENLIHLSTEQ